MIKLAENPWSASALNVAVAKILLEEQLGDPVEVVDHRRKCPMASASPPAIFMPAWKYGRRAMPTTSPNTSTSRRSVENGGLAWPDRQNRLVHPDLFTARSPRTGNLGRAKGPRANAKLFATAETGDKGQFLTGDPSWTQYDADIIKNLGLDFQVVTAGSEEALLAALDAAYSRKAPLLFYFWTPHWIHAKYDLTEVKLPPYSEACYAKAASGGVDCDYPPDDLFKIFWTGLPDLAPDAYTLLKNMNYSTKDQIGMIAAVELDNKSVEDAARAWLDNHEDRGALGCHRSRRPLPTCSHEKGRQQGGLSSDHCAGIAKPRSHHIGSALASCRRRHPGGFLVAYADSITILAVLFRPFSGWQPAAQPAHT